MAIAIGLLKTLLELGRARRTGALDAKGSGASVRIYVEEGAIVFADEGTVGETLGRILVREKVLTEAQYGEALERMADLRVEGKKTKLGELFVQLGMLTADQLAAALSAQVRQKVVRALGWPRATVSFTETQGPLELDGRFPTAVEPLVLAMLRRTESSLVEALFSQSLGRYPALHSDASSGAGAGAETRARIDLLDLKPAEREIALGFDGTRTTAEILAGASEANADAPLVLAALLLTDCLDLHASARGPRRAALPGARPTIRRSAKAKATTGSIAEKIASASKLPIKIPSASASPPRPSSVRPRAAEDVEQVKKVTERLRSAREAQREMPPVSAEPKPELALVAPPESLGAASRLLAEKAFQQGKNFVRANMMKEALVELRRATSFFPAAEYELWASWVAMRAEPENERKRAEEARAAAAKALEEDPGLGFAYFVLGHIALRSGDAKRAKELFERARELDPEAAQDGRDVRLRNTAETPSAETRGNLRSLAPLLTATPEPAATSAEHIAEGARASAVPEVARKSRPSEASPRSDEPAVVDATAPDAEAAASATRSRTPIAPIAIGVALALVAVVALAVTKLSRRDATTTDLAAASASVALASTPKGDDASANGSPTNPSNSTNDDAGEELIELGEGDAGAITTTATTATDASAADGAAADGGASVPFSLASLGEQEGAVDLPEAAQGHRVFVDGKVVGEPTGPIVVPCGARVVKVGSSGRELKIDVPCKGRVSLEERGHPIPLPEPSATP